MGAEMQRMKEIDENPPATLGAANLVLQAKYQEALSQLSLLNDTAFALKRHYFNVANSKGTTPLAALFGDFSTLTTYGAQSGIQYVDKKGLGPISLCKTVLINGPSGIGKSNLIDWERSRMKKQTLLLIDDFKEYVTMQAAADPQGDIEMTPAPLFSHLNFDTVTSVDCQWDPIRYQKVKYYFNMY